MDWGMSSLIHGLMIWSRPRLFRPLSFWRAMWNLTGCLLCSSFVDNKLTKKVSSPLSRLLEQGLFELERGEGQMARQHQAKYAAAVGTQLLAKIHMLHNKVVQLDQCQDHLIDRLDERIDFMGEATVRLGPHPTN